MDTIENNQKDFDLGIILSITSSRILTDIQNIYIILNYLTGDEIYTHQLGRVWKYAKNYILSIHPELNGVGEDVIINNEEDAKKFIESQKSIYGDTLTLKPILKQYGYNYIDPTDELMGSSR